jgi:hypothetical protein
LGTTRENQATISQILLGFFDMRRANKVEISRTRQREERFTAADNVDGDEHKSQRNMGCESHTRESLDGKAFGRRLPPAQRSKGAE